MAVEERLQAALREGDDELRKSIKAGAEESGKAAAQEAMEAERTAKDYSVLLELSRGALARSLARRSALSELSTLRGTPLTRALMQRPQPAHAIERDQVTLTLINPPDRLMECSVRTSRSVHRTSVASLVEGGSVQTKFPANFDPPTKLEPGEYAVEWQPIKLMRSEDQFVPTPGAIVARDSFEIPVQE